MGEKEECKHREQAHGSKHGGGALRIEPGAAQPLLDALLSSGADVDLADVHGASPRRLAERHGLALLPPPAPEREAEPCAEDAEGSERVSCFAAFPASLCRCWRSFDIGRRDMSGG